MIKLTLAQRESLADALTSAFHNQFELKVLARAALDLELAKIIGNVGLTEAATAVVDWSSARGLLEALLRTARERNPGNPDLKQFLAGFALPDAPFANVQGIAKQNGSYESVVFEASGFEDPDAWRRGMMECERRVCQVLLGGTPNGSGYLVGPDLILTNHHVLGKRAWGDVSVLFDFRGDGKGKVTSKGTPFKAVGAGPVAQSDRDALDFALIRLEEAVGDAPIGEGGGPARGWLQLRDHDFAAGEALLVLQHPDGRTLSLAIGSVTAVDTNRIAHCASTEKGSSGSPCFSAAWDLVAMHHWGSTVANRAVKCGAIRQSIAAHLPD